MRLYSMYVLYIHMYMQFGRGRSLQTILHPAVQPVSYSLTLTGRSGSDRIDS